MLDRKFVFDNFERVKKNQLNRGQVAISSDDMDRFYTLMQEKSQLEIKNKLNQKECNYSLVNEIENTIKLLEKEIYLIEIQMAALTDEDVPIGVDSSENITIKEEGIIKEYLYGARSHVQIGELLNILDFDRAAKVAKHMHVYYLRLGARLERAVYNFMLDTHVDEHGYDEMITPYIVDESVMFNSGLYPRFRNEFFHTDFEDYSLIPSAEPPIENFHAGEVLKESDLPIKYTALSPCFRVEHGDCVA